MENQRLYKRERLRSTTDINRLFAPQTGGVVISASVMAYPWRAVAMPAENPKVTFPRILIMVPKRRLRHAVDRVTMRRRMREAYRLLRSEIILPGLGLDIALIYVADHLTPYTDSCNSIRRIFHRLNQNLSGNECTAE